MADYEAKVEEAKDEGKPPAYVPPPVTTRLDVSAAFEQKRDAMLVHRTQFSPEGMFRTVPEDIGRLVFGEEHYSLINSRIPAADNETDLFAGLE